MIKEDIRAILQSLAGWLISLGITVIAMTIWPVLDDINSRHKLEISLSTGQWVVSIIIFVSLFITLTLIFRRSIARAITYTNREAVMLRNIELVRDLCRNTQDDFLSTRVTHWDISEDSVARNTFRSLIAEKIMSGVLVKRIWQLRIQSDLDRLEEYINKYSKYDNYHLRVMVDINIPIPDIICVGRKGASISFPEMRSPRQISLAIQFRNPSEVEAIRKYFELLWEFSIPIKAGNHIEYDRLRDIRATLKT